MEILLYCLSGGALLLGTAALLVGALGLVRLPNLFSRIHAVGMIDTAGVALITFGMLVHEGFSLVSVKLVVVGAFLFFTSPIATHAVAQVAYRSGFSPVRPASKKGATKAAKKTAKKTAGAKKVARKAAVRRVDKKATAKKKSAKKRAS
jgi:multicomponent Na+:H+ antiporter subunit G